MCRTFQLGVVSIMSLAVAACGQQDDSLLGYSPPPASPAGQPVLSRLEEGPTGLPQGEPWYGDRVGFDVRFAANGLPRRIALAYQGDYAGIIVSDGRDAAMLAHIRDAALPEGVARFGQLAAVAFGAGDALVVADVKPPRLIWFKPDGTFERETADLHRGKLAYPCALSASASGKVVLVDRDARATYVMDWEGRNARLLEAPGGPALARPTACVIRPGVGICVGDPQLQIVRRFADDGRWVGDLALQYPNATIARYVADTPELAVTGLAITADGGFYVSQAVPLDLGDMEKHDSIARYDSRGTLAWWCPPVEITPQGDLEYTGTIVVDFWTPRGLALSPDERTLYVLEEGGDVRSFGILR